jgi:hypothetical protein
VCLRKFEYQHRAADLNAVTRREEHLLVIIADSLVVANSMDVRPGIKPMAL